jgi:short-subunit dehydrogenase
MRTPTFSERPVVVITGASGGIGAALARYVAPTHGLSLVARRAAELTQVSDGLTAAYGTSVLTITADVTNRGEVQRIVRETLARFGRIDAWVNNVGQGITCMPSELTDDDIDDMMRINVKSALYGMQEVLPHFKAVGRGHIINISSMLGRAPFALPRSAYSAAKHFLNALTANFRTEVQGTHPEIQVSLISPGVVRTDFGLHARHGGIDSRQLPESQSANEVATVIAAVLADRRADVYTRTGSAARIAGIYASIGVDP